jgi:hypothetical protein
MLLSAESRWEAAMSPGTAQQGTAANSYHELVAEIAPAMKESLDRQGILYVALAYIVIWFIADYADDLVAVEAQDLLQVGKFALLIACIAVGPVVGREFVIGREVKYRRQHGKWRWDH